MSYADDMTLRYRLNRRQESGESRSVSYTHLDVYKRQLHVSSDVAALDYGRAHDVVVRPRTPQPVHLDGDPFPAVDEARWRVAASELIVLTRGPN